MASSAAYGESKFNLAAQGHRQPGSTFKVMALMAALRAGVDPDTTTYVSSRRSSSTIPRTGPDRGLDLRRQRRRQHQPAQGDAGLGQLRLHPARARPRPGQGQAGGVGHGDPVASWRRYPAETLGGLTDGVLAAGDGQRLRDDRLRRLPQPARPRSRGSRSPTAARSSRRAGRSGARKAFEDGVTAKATEILEQNIQGGTGTKASIGCPAGGKTGHHRQVHRRVVRRLHAAPGDRRVGRLSQRPHADVGPLPRRQRGRRHVPRRDLGHVHEGGQGQVLRRLPAAQDAVPGPRRSSAGTRPAAAARAARRRRHGPTRA